MLRAWVGAGRLLNPEAEEGASGILTDEDIFQETWLRVGDVGKPTTHDFKYFKCAISLTAGRSQEFKTELSKRMCIEQRDYWSARNR